MGMTPNPKTPPVGAECPEGEVRSVVAWFDPPMERCDVCGVDLKLHWRGRPCLAAPLPKA